MYVHVANTIFSKPPTGLLGIDLTKYGLPNTWVGLQTAVDNVAALRASLLPILVSLIMMTQRESASWRVLPLHSSSSSM
jgi:hypothetical protein